MFVHSGIMHLLYNIVALFIAAIYLEPLLSRKNYLILYFLSGLCADIVSISWYYHTVSVGASGAIFGLFGATLALLLTDVFPEGSKQSVLISTGAIAGFSLLMGLLGFSDNAAHVGGLFAGAVIGLVMWMMGAVKPVEHQPKRRGGRKR